MRIVFFIVALLALAFWAFAAFDMWAALTAWPPYAEQYGTDMFAWIQGFPLWRKAILGAGVAFGVVGSLLMFSRAQFAGPALLFAWLLLAGGVSYSVGIVFYRWETLRYHHAIWHLFVLAGSVFHYFAVLLYVIPDRAAP